MRETYGNVAYDLKRFEKTKKLEVIHEQKKVKRAPILIVNLCNFLMCAIVAVCAGGLIFGYTNITLLTQESARLKNDLAVLESQEVSLNAQIENMFNLEFVESYVKENLNMIKLDKNQVEHVYIQNADTITVNGKEKNGNSISNGLSQIYYSILEYIK